MEENLLFFNKEGYPYNFIYNEENERYEGKIYFDSNSNDTFKTQGLYIFENVPSQELTDKFQFETFRLFDYSGITFISGNEDQLVIKDIRKVNSSEDFYSKWIIGDNFNKKFPIGSMVNFENFTEDSFDNSSAYLDFTQSPYFTVIDNKADAIMVLTPTKNSNWNYEFNKENDYETIKSQNYILFNDYSGELVSNISDVKLDPGQAISVYNTLDDDNNGIYITDERYYTECFYDIFNLSGLSSGDTLNVELELFTERPKIYEGSISGTIESSSGFSEIKFENGLSSLFERDDFLNFETGTTIVFEDLDDNELFNNNTFVVTGIKDSEDLGEYVIEFEKILNKDQTILNISNLNNSIYDWVLAEPTNENLQEVDNRYKSYDYYLKLNNNNEFKLQSFYDSQFVIQSGTTVKLGNIDTEFDEENSSFRIVSGLINPSLISFESTTLDGNYYLSHDLNNNDNSIKFRKFGSNLSETNYNLVKNDYDSNKFNKDLISRALKEEILIKEIDLSFYTTKSKWKFTNNNDNFNYNELFDIEYTFNSNFVEFHADTPYPADENGYLTWQNTYSQDVNFKIDGEIWYKYTGNIIVKIDNVIKFQFNQSPYTPGKTKTQIWNNKTFKVPSNSTIKIEITNQGDINSEAKLKIENISLFYPYSKPQYNFNKSPELQSAMEAIKNQLSYTSFDDLFEIGNKFLESEILRNKFQDLKIKFDNILNKDSLPNLFYTHINDNFTNESATYWNLQTLGTSQSSIINNKLLFKNNGDSITRINASRKDVYFKKNKTIRITFDLTVEDGDNPEIELKLYDKNNDIVQKTDLTITGGTNINDVLIKENAFKFEFNFSQTNYGSSYMENLKIQYKINKNKAAAIKVIRNNIEELNLNNYLESIDDASDIFINKLNFLESATFKRISPLSYSEQFKLSSLQSYNYPNYYVRARNDSLFLDLYSSTGTYPEESSFNIIKEFQKEKEIKLLDELIFKVSNENQNKNINRKVKVVDIIANEDDENWGNIKYKLETPIIPEEWSTYNIVRSFKNYEIDTLYCTTSYMVDLEFEYSAITYLTTNKITLEQEYLDNLKNTLDSFFEKYRNDLINKGIYAYSGNTSGITSSSGNSLIFEGIYSYNEDDSSGYSKHFNINPYISNNSGNSYLTGLTTKELDRFWIRTYNNFEETKRIPIYGEVGRNHKIKINFDLNNNSQDYGVRIKINSIDSYVDFDTGTSTTLNNFVTQNYNKYLNNAILISSTGNSILIEGLLPDVFIWDTDITTNFYSSYEIIENTNNQGVIIESSQLVNTWSGYTGIDFIEETQLSTGMVINISGNTIPPTGLTFLDNKDYNIINLLGHRIQLSYQGYIPKFSATTYENVINEEVDIGTLKIKSDKYLRRPRRGSIDSYVFSGAFFRALSNAFDIRYFEKGDGKDFYFRFRWEDDETNDIFYYDFSGEQKNLMYGPKDPSGNRIESLKYNGQKPLYNPEENNQINLNDEPNLNTMEINNPSKQQTVFEELEFLLDKRNSRNAELLPEPVQAFIGFQAENEGVSQRTMILEIVEYLTFSGYTNSEEYPTKIEFELTSGLTISGTATLTYVDLEFSGSTSGETNFDFKEYGFEVGQLISMKFNDLSDEKQNIFENYEIYKITRISKLELDIEIINKNYNNFKTIDSNDRFFFEIKVEPNEILRCQFFGETEVEDERFKVNLKNLGIQVDDDIEKLFEKSDIDDDGIDYNLLNRKRKEMLINYPELYNYIGSYKALVNALKFFGYDNLQLYEYYRNIDSDSPMYQKLQRVLVRDIFNREVEGFTKEDWVEKQNDINNFKKTSLFNLTYQITDDDGNYVLFFSLDEVQQKLEGIKNWLRRYILPLSSNIVDITGVVETKDNLDLVSEVSNQVLKFTTKRESTGIDFFIEQTLNFETNYLATIHWYNILENFDPSQGWSFRIKTFSLDSNNRLITQQSFEIDKYDLEPFSFNYNRDLDPYIWIETSYYDGNGIGIVREIVQDMKIARNYYLINHRLIPYRKGLKYLNLSNKNKSGEYEDGFYFFDNEGYMVLDDNILDLKYPDARSDF